MANELRKAIRGEFRGFETVHIKKEKLLAALIENLAVHKKEFQEAHAGYQQAQIELLEQMLADARAGKEIARVIDLDVPHDHSEDYEEVIQMLQWSEDEEFEISRHDFNTFVLDKWAWKESFKMSTANYSGRIR